MYSIIVLIWEPGPGKLLMVIVYHIIQMFSKSFGIIFWSTEVIKSVPQYPLLARHRCARYTNRETNFY